MIYNQWVWKHGLGKGVNIEAIFKEIKDFKDQGGEEELETQP